MIMTEDIYHAECPYCGVFVQFVGMGSISLQTHASLQALGLQCPSCQEGNVVIMRGDAWRRYPARQPRDIPGVPENVMQAFREAVLALEAGAPRAAACMIRRTVASAASDLEVPDEEGGRRLPLQSRIDRLKDRLLPATYAAARGARLLGDAGAHEEAEERLGPIDADTVRRTIAIVRQFLGNLYELPKQVEELGLGSPNTPPPHILRPPLAGSE